MEELVTLRGDGVLGEWSNEPQSVQGAVDLVGAGVGVPECRKELLVDPADLRVEFLTATG